MSDYTYTAADWRENAKYGLVGVTADDATEHWDRWLREHDARVRAETLREFADEYESTHARIKREGATAEYWRGADDAHDYFVARLRSAAGFQLHGHEGEEEDYQ